MSFEEKMVPGQSPYSSEERAALSSLIEDAAAAEEEFDEWELEEAVAEFQKKHAPVAHLD